MGSKNKLKRFKENETFHNVYQPTREELLNNSYDKKGHWREKVFNNNNPIVLGWDHQGGRKCLVLLAAKRAKA